MHRTCCSNHCEHRDRLPTRCTKADWRCSYASGSLEPLFCTENNTPVDEMADLYQFMTAEYLHTQASSSLWDCMNSQGYDAQLKSLQSYLQSHPPCFDGEDASDRPDTADGICNGPKLTIRERARNENGKFHCDICGRRYARRERMETCQSNHREEKKHICKGECGVVGW